MFLRKDKNLLSFLLKVNTWTREHILNLTRIYINSHLKDEERQNRFSVRSFHFKMPVTICIAKLQEVTQARPKWKQGWYGMENITLPILHGHSAQPRKTINQSTVQIPTGICCTFQPVSALTNLDACKCSVRKAQANTNIL